MKLMVGRRAHQSGFALPTVLLVSIAMITILVASIAAVAASRVSLDSQYYNKLAQQAIESGMARASECLKGSGFVPQWGINAENRDLRPNSDCTGATLSGSWVSPYVVEDIGGSSANLRTKYSIDAPSGTGIGSSLRVIGTTELVRTSNPNSVWRSYTQVAHMQIEPPETVACPEGFIPVPGDSRFNTNDFCVGKYEAKNVGGKAVSQAEGAPWVSISQTDAIRAAADACTGCSLISEAQWMTLAHNALDVSSNWSGRSVGSGYIFRGHSDNSPSTPLAASVDDSEGYHGTGNTGGDQRRTLRLNNGEIIWDLAGNAYEWTKGTIASGKPGLGGETSVSHKEYNNTNIEWNSLPVTSRPLVNTYSRDQGVGTLFSDPSNVAERAFLRGGAYGHGDLSGVLNLDINSRAPNGSGANIGFRVVFDPLSQIRCPEGHIPVPGNSQFGTKNFCVGKYEAKNVGGAAVSRAEGVPWTNISQSDAMAAAGSACVSCRLIGEAEWLTIAHNIANNSSNWTGGSVGSGTLFTGHSDNSPGAVLAASSDDGSGYSGTLNSVSSGANQRRTLNLNNGEVIWDFAGNAAEWMADRVPHANYPKPIGGWREWNATTDISGLNPNPLPEYGTPAARNWTRTHGIGGVLPNTNGVSDPGAVARGGSRTHGINAGIFGANYNMALMYDDVGFRTVSDPISTIPCSPGFVAVPGDSRFGTNDFCVGKYEAKNVGGVAVSQPDGLPWTSISQTNAIVAASNACADCRLIGEAEWLTIAHNIASVASNWSGGSIGSGYIYSGNNDGSPGVNLAASSNDADYYSGTGNTSGNQRRTLTLSNGEVIWDLAGNAWEWTSGQITGNQPGSAGAANRNWNTVTDTGTLIPNPFPAFGTPAASAWTTSHGIGVLYSDTNVTTLRAFRRGGGRSNGSVAGIFTLSFGSTPTAVSADIGFRVVEVKQP